MLVLCYALKIQGSKTVPSLSQGTSEQMVIKLCLSQEFKLMVVKFPKFSNVAEQGNVQRILPRTHPISSKQMEQVALLGLHTASHTQQHKHSTQGGISSQGTQPAYILLSKNAPNIWDP